MMTELLHQLTMTVLMKPDKVNFSGNGLGDTIPKLLDQLPQKNYC